MIRKKMQRNAIDKKLCNYIGLRLTQRPASELEKVYHETCWQPIGEQYRRIRDRAARQEAAICGIEILEA